ERLSSSKHGKQTQQQHFRERIEDLAVLSQVRKILEILQKNNCLSYRPSRCSPVHRIPGRSNQRITTDSALYAFVTYFFTRLPCDAPPIVLHGFQLCDRAGIGRN